MKIKRQKDFANGSVFCFELEDGMLIETTDTFLPFYTKDAIGRKQNTLKDTDLGNRSERWMCGISVSSGCPVHCKFCATGQMKGFRNLSAREMIDQIEFVIDQNIDYEPSNSKEFKINMTRMGDYALNVDNVKTTINYISKKYPNTHFFLSTIGIKGTDFSWIKDNITLQLSLHSLDDAHRDWLIPYNKKMSIEELGQVRTQSNLKTTLNLSLVNDNDFDIVKLKKYFDPEYFFIKISPINPNTISEKNNIGKGIIEGVNLI